MKNNMSKWLVYAKKADFKAIGEQYGIDQVTARIIRNRDICTKEALDMYLHGTPDDLHDASLLKDAVRAVGILVQKIQENAPIRIIGDYDIDGVCSISILYKALKHAGACVDYTVPHRITDGYGINEHLIDEAAADGIDTIITCDNGIAAIDQIHYAKMKKMTVIVTDHHDIPFRENENGREYLQSEADAVVNPKQSDCKYPFKLLCGAGVALKLVQLLYDRLKLEQAPLAEYQQLAAIATVGDVVDLTDENRILVKYGLKSMVHTKNAGIRALVEACQLDISHLSAYHIGFVIGPCLNASGRLDTARKAVELLLEENPGAAYAKAEQLRAYNDERKKMTEEETAKAIAMVEESPLAEDHVLVVYLPSCHESIAGIIAGRLREHFYRPALVLTDAMEGAKGSGRSIEGYNMFEEISKCAHLLNKFGGHPMAAGISLDRENIEEFRYLLNRNEQLTKEQLTPVTWIDVPMPAGYVTMPLIQQFEQLEPFGKGNEKPLFADKKLTVRSADRIGKNRNVLKMQLETTDGHIVEAVQFHAENVCIPQRGQQIAMVYYPDMNEYNGRRTIQFIVKEWRLCNN